MYIADNNCQIDLVTDWQTVPTTASWLEFISSPFVDVVALKWRHRLDAPRFVPLMEALRLYRDRLLRLLTIQYGQMYSRNDGLVRGWSKSNSSCAGHGNVKSNV